jgi:hypothetical protein
MKAQKLRGREGRNSAKIFLIAALFICIMLQPLKADIVWESGHHEIIDGDIYTEIWIYNDATADMFGGDVYKLETFDITAFDMFTGVMDILDVHDNSSINIHGGSLGTLGAADDSSVNLYAYDVIYHPTGGYYDRGWVEGKYLDNDLYFSYDLIHIDSFSHLNVVPEPATLLLLGFGAFLVRKIR